MWSQIDAHLDFVDERKGITEGHGNPMRRAIEKDYVSGMTQLGIRNVSSTAKEGYEDARARGSDILSVRQVRKLGTEGVLDVSPKARAITSLLISTRSVRRLHPEQEHPATAGSNIMMFWKSFRGSANAAMWLALIWLRSPPPMTKPKARKFLRRSCC